MVVVDLLFGLTTEAFQSLGVALDNSAIAGGVADRTKQAWNDIAMEHISPMVAGLCLDAMPGLEGMPEGVEGLPLYVVPDDDSPDTEVCVFSLLYTEVGNSARIAQVARHEKEKANPDTIAKERALLDNAISRLNRPMRNLADTFRVGTHVASIAVHLCDDAPSWTGLAGVAKVATEDHIFSEANGSMAFQTTEAGGIINQHAVSSLFAERADIANAEAHLATMKANVSKRESGARRAYYAQSDVEALVPDNRKKSAKNAPSAVTQGAALSAILERGLPEEERATLVAQREALAVS